MQESLETLLNVAIDLELAVSKLYGVFAIALPDAEEFWGTLSLEELNHASLIRSGRDFFLPAGHFPNDLLHQNICATRELLHLVNEKLAAWKKQPCSLSAACEIALQIETAAQEKHFQLFMENTSAVDDSCRLFQDLNQADKDHAQRIRAFMAERTIHLP